MFSIGNRLIAALDVPDRGAAEAFVAQLGGVPAFYKIGLELFCAEGPSLVRDFARADRRVMLDLKLHDIPETVGRATARVAGLGAELLTVHADGGRKMLQAAVAAARAGGATKVLAITVLTSMDGADLADTGVVGSVVDVVVRRARLAIEAGCDGVVASPHEVAAVRAVAPPGFLIVTPGVRPADGTSSGAADDQKRVMTPRQARAAGSDLIVVGRPLRDAADPATAARAIAAEMAALA